MKARSLYGRFHGRAPRREATLRMPEPETLICLGDVVEIVYRCDKLNGGGDGKMAEYAHKFARGAKLFCDESGRGWLYIHGDRIVVQEPGIIN